LEKSYRGRREKKRKNTVNSGHLVLYSAQKPLGPKAKLLHILILCTLYIFTKLF
jgi:hypothetical protein